MDDQNVEEKLDHVMTLPTTEIVNELKPGVSKHDNASESLQEHEVEQQGINVTSAEENGKKGEDSIIHLEYGVDNQELLKNITSQDAECQTMLQELIENLGEPGCNSAEVERQQTSTTVRVESAIILPPTHETVVTNFVSTTPEANGASSDLSLSTTGTNMSSIPVSTATDLDETKSINITCNSQAEVIINGTKYLLIVKPDSNQICAYPVEETENSEVKKKTGRPKTVVQTEETVSSSVCDMVETDSGTGESQTDAAEGLLELCNTGPDGARRSVRKRKRSKALEDYDTKDVQVPKTMTPLRKPVPIPRPKPTGPVVKKVRGRPRRYPPPGQSSTTKIPAVIIPGPNGRTLMMAPIKGIQNLQAFQQQMNKVPHMLPASLVSKGQINSLPDGSGDNKKINGAIGEDNQAVNSITAGGDQPLTLATDNIVCGEQITTSIANTPHGNATVIKLPEDIISLYTKQEPLTLGLKANEVELESLRCIKCSFQAYFREQYQNHISQHADEVIKCKCCEYLSFFQEDIITHTRNFHPRCICTLCDFTGDHAYVVKRHMSRHNSVRFNCAICGKVYKDQYILRMHVKMVHMPADVLFECVTCDKKFTRKAHLKRHLRIHEPNKPYKCSQCEYRGSEKSDIVKHSKVHEDPQYACELCGKHFRHVKNRDLHIKRHRGQKDYKCGICDFFGYTFTDIRKHIERKHWAMEKQVREGNEYNCAHCNLAFSCSSQQELVDHQVECLATIEQTLSITNSSGETSRAFLRLPRELEDGAGNKIVTVEEVQMNELEVDLEEHGVTLTEDQLLNAVHDPSRTLVLDSSSLVTEQHLIIPGETETTLIVTQ